MATNVESPTQIEPVRIDALTGDLPDLIAEIAARAEALRRALRPRTSLLTTASRRRSIGPRQQMNFPIRPIPILSASYTATSMSGHSRPCLPCAGEGGPIS